MTLCLIVSLVGVTLGLRAILAASIESGSESESESGPLNIKFLTEHNQKKFFKYGSFERVSPVVRGVNLGGWLVLEPFITPSLFEVFRQDNYSDRGIPVDEYHYTKTLGHDLATRRLHNHWSSFITEKDFSMIKNMGFNLVRIPIGYWAFETLPDDPYVSGHQEHYLDNAIQWAADNGLKVWVDLHSAAGSQNGFDNSGLRDHYGFQEQSNLNLTRRVIHYLLDKYSLGEYVDTVIGVQLLNEPLGPLLDMDELEDFYLENYNYLRQSLGRDQIVVIHDAFQQPLYWNQFLTEEEGYWGVLVDHHHYQVFDPQQLNATFEDKLRLVCSWGESSLNDTHWNIAGEFSAALTDCTKWLNGVGYNARYDGTFLKGNQSSFYIGSCTDNENFDSWSQERKDQTRAFLETQLNAFEMRNGWIFWTYKTEDGLEWDAQRLTHHGLLPQPLDDRKFPNYCKNQYKNYHWFP